MAENEPEPAKNDAPKEEVSAPEKTMGKFDRGDYMISLLLQSLKNLKKIDKKAEGSLEYNVLIEVEINGVKKYSNAKDVTTDQDFPVKWDETLYFEFEDLTPDKCKTMQIIIRFFNKGWMRNELIAVYEIDVSSIYFKTNHVLEHQWVGLSNPESDDYDEIKGMFKASFSVQHHKDNPYHLEPQTTPENPQASVMMPTQLKRTYKQLKLKFFDLRYLTFTKGWFGQAKDMTMYLECDYKSSVPFQTTPKTIKQQKLKPTLCVFNEEFWLPIQVPVTNDRLVIKFYLDRPVFGRELYASMYFSVKDLLAQGSQINNAPSGEYRGLYIWKSIFGAPVGDDLGNKAEGKIMNEQPELASYYRGSLLMHIEAEEQEKPIKIVQRKTDVETRNNLDDLAMYDTEVYHLKAEMGQGLAMPDKKRDYKLKLRICQNEIESDKPKVKEGDYVRWSENPKLKEIEKAQSFYSQLSNVTTSATKQKGSDKTVTPIRIELPKILDHNNKLCTMQLDAFVYLVDEDDKEVSFWQSCITNFYNNKASRRWIQLKADKAVGEVTDDRKAGLISLKLQIVREIQVDLNQFQTTNSIANPKAGGAGPATKPGRNRMASQSRHSVKIEGLGSQEKKSFEQEKEKQLKLAHSKFLPNSWQVPGKRLNTWKVRIFIFQCEDLPSADLDGASDPFVQIWTRDDEIIKTETIEDSANPMFMEAKEIELDFGYYDDYSEQILLDKVDVPPLIMDINDLDKGGTFTSDSTKFIGRATIDLANSENCIWPKKSRRVKHKGVDSSSSDSDFEQEHSNSIPDPKWHDVKYGIEEGAPKCGRILCSFSVQTHDFVFAKDIVNVNLNEKVKTSEYKITINALGLRNLESSGILPVQKAFVKFNIKSLLPPSAGNSIQENIQTTPTETGSDPNINATVTFSVQLPEEELYTPKMTCQVYDTVFAGWSQPLIGAFSINLGKMIQETKSQKAVKRQKLDEIKAKLDELSGKKKRKSTQNNLIQNEDDDKVQLIDTNQVQIETKREGNSKEEQKSKDWDKMKKGVEKKIDDKKQSDILMTADQRKAAADARQEEKNQRKSEAAQLRDQKAQNGDTVQQIVLPIYKYDNDIKIWQIDLDKKPSELLYVPIGFNDQPTILKYMTCILDEDKIKNLMADAIAGSKSDLDLGSTSRVGLGGTKSQQKKSKASDTAKEQKLKEATKITNFHYRRIVLDELEFDEDIFPQPVFTNLDIMRGQSRGLAKQSALMSFFNKRQVDDSGAESNEKVVGLFKGLVTCEKVEGAIKQEKTKRLSHLAQQRKSQKAMGNKIGKKVNTKIQLADKSSDSESFSDNEIQEEQLIPGKIQRQNTSAMKRKANKDKFELQEDFKYIKDIYEKKTSKKVDFELESLNDTTTVYKFRGILQEIGMTTFDSRSICNHFQELSLSTDLQKQLQTQVSVVVHLYLLSSADLPSKDIGSESDPYLYVTCGDFKYDGRDFALLDEPNPAWNKYLTWVVSMPGVPSLKIQVWDEDSLFGDDIIGETVVDLDDRYFQIQWRNLQEKPVEVRELHTSLSKLSQGTLTMWLDLEPNPPKQEVKPEVKLWALEPEPEQELEVRLAVFGTRNVPAMDSEGTSDVFIKAVIDEDEQETDTHWRCTTGKASFNFRILQKVKTPRPPTKGNCFLKLQCYDRDIFKSNDRICQWNVDITPMIDAVRLSYKPTHLTKDAYENTFKDRMHSSTSELRFGPANKNEEKDGVTKDDTCFWLTATAVVDEKPINVQVCIDLRVVPPDYAEKNPVGKARSEPNNEPMLPQPIGRFKLSMNPFAMLNQLCSDDVRKKIYKNLCCAFCIVFCIYFGPMIAGDFGSAAWLSIQLSMT